MPEGDTYTRAARRLRPVLVGQVIIEVGGSAPSVRRRHAQMAGAAVESVRTHGKHLLIDLETGLTIHIHLGMPGRILTSRPDDPPRVDQGTIRMVLTTDIGAAWVLAAPTVEVDKRESVEMELARLGPDVLADEFDMALFAERAARYPGDRTVSDFLLDQRVLAGVGNEYKNEVLFMERIAPERLMDTIDDAARVGLARRARRLMLPNAHRAVRSTTGRPDGGLWVYDRAGEPCRRCRTQIRQAQIGEPPRVTFWCPSCQA